MKKILNLLLIAIVAVNTVACKKNNDTDLFLEGTVVVEGGFAALLFMLVEVDEKYPIGESMNFTEDMRWCYNFDKAGLYGNLIQVQCSEKSFADRDDKYTVGNTISFLYREYNRDTDRKLFEGLQPFSNSTTLSNSNQDVSELDCSFPAVPLYVITDYKILK
jgi:hypothetical protein